MERQGTKQFGIACANHFEDVADDTVHSVPAPTKHSCDHCRNDQTEEFRLTGYREREHLERMRSAQVVRLGLRDLDQIANQFRSPFGREPSQYADWPGRDGHDSIGLPLLACGLECGIEQCRTPWAIREFSRTRQRLATVPRVSDAMRRDRHGFRVIGRHLPNARASANVVPGDLKFAHVSAYTCGRAIRPTPCRQPSLVCARPVCCWTHNAAMRSCPLHIAWERQDA